MKPADVVLRGGAIHTLEPGAIEVTALAARGGVITWLGDDDAAADHIGRGTQVIDLGGRLVLPGFVDAHNHLRLGTGADAVQLAGAKSLGEIRARIGAWLDAHPEAEWVYGEGFDYAALPGGRHPRAADLDGATQGRPAFLLDYSVHAAWLNEDALVLLGIDGTTAATPYGQVERDHITGKPTGYLTDFATRGLSRAGLAALQQCVPAFSLDAQYARVRASLAMATRFGITTVVEPQNSLDDLALFRRARAEGALTSRVVAALFHPPGTPPDELDAFEAARAAGDGWFSVGPLKLYIDDIVEPHTAAMLEPYANRPDTRGKTYYDAAEFAEVVTRLDSRGFSCFVHATGDRGIRVTLDAFQAARHRNGVRDARHQVVHVECLHADDLPRFAELGVVACMQPRHCAPEIVEQWRENVGPQRWRYAWPMASLARTGAVLALSSDWNVAEMDPLVGLYSAVTRSSLDGTRSWVPQERLDLDTALRGYTLGSAYSVFAEERCGSLRVGKDADLAVLSRDIREVEPQALLDTRVELTMVGGTMPHREI